MKNWFVGAWVFAMVVVPTALVAQDAGVKIGDSNLIPSVKLSYQSTDNAFRQSEDPVDATGIAVTPTIRWEADKGRIAVAAQYQGEYFRSSEESLDRTWHTLLLQGTAAANSRHRFDTTFAVRDLTESQDEGFSRLVESQTLEELVRFRNVNARLGYTFGSISARGNVRFELLAASRSYTNQVALTDGGDYTVLRPAVDFSYRVGGDSRAFVTLRQATVDYDRVGSDRTELSALVGIRLNENRKLSGDVAIGAGTTDYDNGTDETTTIVEAGLAYAASSYSNLSLDFSREFVDNDGQASVSIGSATIQNSAEFAWLFEWSSRIRTIGRLEYTGNDRTCPSNNNAVFLAGLEVQYQFRRWLSFGVGVDGESNSVDLCSDASEISGLSADNDYDRMSANVFLRASL